MTSHGIEYVSLNVALLNTGNRWFAVIDLTNTPAGETKQPFALINVLRDKVEAFRQAPLVLTKRDPLGRWAFEGEQIYRHYAAGHIADMEAAFHPVPFPLLP